jgi:hypothetical protein
VRAQSAGKRGFTMFILTILFLFNLFFTSFLCRDKRYFTLVITRDGLQEHYLLLPLFPTNFTFRNENYYVFLSGLSRTWMKEERRRRRRRRRE